MVYYRWLDVGETSLRIQGERIIEVSERIWPSRVVG